MERRTYKERIVEALERLGGRAHYKEIYEMFELISDEPLPESWQFCIQRCIQDHSSDSHGYKGKEDLFYSVEGLGSGYWGLRNYRENKNKD